MALRFMINEATDTKGIRQEIRSLGLVLQVRRRSDGTQLGSIYHRSTSRVDVDIGEIFRRLCAT